MKVPYVFSLVVVLCLFGFVTVAAADQTVDPSQAKQLQQQMLANPDVMALITALQSDPEMQALLSDPAFVEAAQKGDTATLTADPRFQKLLNNPKVQAIIRQMR